MNKKYGSQCYCWNDTRETFRRYTFPLRGLYDRRITAFLQCSIKSRNSKTSFRKPSKFVHVAFWCNFLTSHTHKHTHHTPVHIWRIFASRECRWDLPPSLRLCHCCSNFSCMFCIYEMLQSAKRTRSYPSVLLWVKSSVRHGQFEINSIHSPFWA